MPNGKAWLTKMKNELFFPCKTLYICSISPLPEEGNGGLAGITHSHVSYL